MEEYIKIKFDNNIIEKPKKAKKKKSKKKKSKKKNQSRIRSISGSGGAKKTTRLAVKG